VGDRVVALGAVRVVRASVQEDDVLDRLVDPGRPIPPASTAVHGITDDLVAGRPPIETVVAELAAFGEGSVLVGHDVAFDLAFLRPAATRAGVTLPGPVLDTMLLSAVAHPGDGEAHTLDALAARLGVDVLGRHTALGDALVTAAVLVRLVPLLEAVGVRTVGEAIAASAATPLARASAQRF
jgi:DNA polymerase-3 subunit epsilon